MRYGNYSKIKKEYEERLKAEEQAAAGRREELYNKYPEYAEMDIAIKSTAYKIMGEISKGSHDIKKRIDSLKKENYELREARDLFLEKNGYPKDYTDIKYTCEKCRDTGFCGTEMCECMKKALIDAEYESSGLAGLMRTQSFDTFSDKYYAGEARETMKHNYNYCVDFAEKFPNVKCGNLMFMGNTGLGKTHLSTAIAKRIIDKGHDVVYDTAQNIFADFEYERFGNSSYGEPKGENTDVSKYFDCDFLIIDDLGTEVSNQFTVACLYNIINTRLNRGKAMLINTNLTRTELRKRYSDRITSRLFGEFIPLNFVGNDVRMLKLNM